MEWGTPVWWGKFLLFCVPHSVKTKETNPTRPGSPTPCKQALITSLALEKCEKECNMLYITLRYKVFVHSELKLPNCLVDSILNHSATVFHTIPFTFRNFQCVVKLRFQIQPMILKQEKRER